MFAQTQNFAYLSHHNEGTLSSSFLWHARFGHINYDNLRMLKKTCVSSFPTILTKLKQCDACILGKYIKHAFHDSTSRTCRKIELIHSYLCSPVLVPYVNGNTYLHYLMRVSISLLLFSRTTLAYFSNIYFYIILRITSFL